MSETFRQRIAQLPSLAESRTRLQPIRNVNKEHTESLTTLDRLAVWVTDRIGTMGFFFIILIWTVVWLLWNVLAPEKLRFDPYPAFVLWLFISNLIQIHLMPLIMVGQNLQGRHSELRAQSDFDINSKAEMEIEAIMAHLEHQNEMILEILRRLESMTIAGSNTSRS